jgi:hypothetical protein
LELIELLTTDLKAKLEENRNDLGDSHRFIASCDVMIDAWEIEYRIDTTELKSVLWLIGFDVFFYNEESPVYNALSSSDLWKNLPDTFNNEIGDVYRIWAMSVKLSLEKICESGTHVKLNFLAPNDLVYRNRTLDELSSKVLPVAD